MTIHKVQVNRSNGDITYATDDGRTHVVMPSLNEYWELERRQLIARLRLLDEMLGREQTIPRRNR